MDIASHRLWSARLVIRHISELLLARTVRWHEYRPQERNLAVVFEIVLSASIAHRPFREPGSGKWLGIAEAATDGRPVNATAIAASMNFPHTTIRRSAAKLVDAGLLVRGAAGYNVAPGFFTDGRLDDVAAVDAAELNRTLSTLATAGYHPAQQAIATGISALPDGVIGRVLLTFALRVVETFSEIYGDVVDGAIVSAIIAANVRHITNDPELSRLYAAEDAPPPDAARRPIGVRELSRAIDGPYETVRRRVNMLIDNDIVVQRDGGVFVPTRVLSSAAHFENNRRLIKHFDQMIHALVALRAGQGD